MDPVSHAIFGRTLIGLDQRRRLGRGAVTACVLGSLAPDLDIVLAPRGWDVYLRWHQAGTHAIAGALVCGALTAAVIRAAAPDSRFSRLFLAASAGALGHQLLDLISGADLRPLWPLTGWPVALPLFAMADPWLVSFFLVAIIALWIRPRARVAGLALALLGVLVGAKGALYARALGLEDRSVAHGTARRADAGWGEPTRWTIFEAFPTRLEAWQVDAVRGRVDLVMNVDRGLADPLVERSRALPTVQNLLRSHGMTLARVRPQPDGAHEVVWTDLRYCTPGSPGLKTRPTSDISCALWFGGDFDARGRATAAIVHVGGFVQRRPPR
ncbi:MAG TPA: metal-dependent hydrolase [Vicinamibacterales bacterium]|nr:metal-dependent hydrolase [Vicinamibacterales bacterium]